MKRAFSATLPLSVLFTASLIGTLLWYPDADRWDLVFWCWVTALACLLWLARSADLAAGRAGDEGSPPWTRGEAVLFSALMLVAVGFRIHDLEVLPGRLHNDEMTCGIEARRFLSEPRPPLFRTGWYGCPNLAFFLTSLPMIFAGPSLVGLRSAGVAAGLLSLAGAYLLVRRVAGVPAAMILLALNATHPWAVHLGRTGLIYVQAAAAGVFILYFFYRALRGGSWFWATCAGIAFGVGFQTYFSIRLMPFILVAAAFVWSLGSGPIGRRRLAEVLCVTSFGALVAVSPLLVHYSTAPSSFGNRTRDVFLLSEKNESHVLEAVGSLDPAAVLGEQLLRTGRFFYPGKDSSAQFGFERSFVPPPLWFPYAAGVALILIRFLRPRKDEPVSGGSLTLLAWIVLTFLAGAVLTIDPPFSPRLSLMQPVFLFPAAVFLTWLWDLGKKRRLASLLASSAVAAAILWTGVVNARDYFEFHRIVAVGGKRDQLPRMVQKYPFIQGVLSLGPLPADFDYQSYTMLAPGRLLVEGTGAASIRQVAERGRSPALIWLVAASPGTEFHPDGEMSVITSGSYEALAEFPESFSFDYWIVGPRTDR